MKRALKWLGVLVLLALVAAGGFLGYVAATGIPQYAKAPPEIAARKVAVTPARIERGRRISAVLCDNCHADPTTGKLSGKVMDDAPHVFGTVVTRNITASKEHGIGGWSDGEIAYLLRTGVARDGRYLPPYMVKLPNLSDEDLDSIIAFLRSDDPRLAAVEIDPPGVTRPSMLVKVLSHTAWKPLPWPSGPIATPPAADAVATGRYLATALNCFTCHSADFKKVDDLQPEKSAGFYGGGNTLLDFEGNEILSANLTPDEETGIGRWSAGDFGRALREGFRPDGSLVRYPMPLCSTLTPAESDAIFAYLRTVPKIRHSVARAAPPAMASAGKGGACYHKYGCNSCHGANGVGLADLRNAKRDYPKDADLVAWIRDAPSKKPGTRMPKWDGVIAEGDYPELVAFVRSLAP